VNAPASIPAVDCVTLEHSFPHLAIVTLNRPEVRNAIDGCVATTLARFVAELDEDPSIRCVILTRAGDQAFSAGEGPRAFNEKRPARWLGR